MTDLITRAIDAVHRAERAAGRSSSTWPTTRRTGPTSRPTGRRAAIGNGRHLHAARRGHEHPRRLRRDDRARPITASASILADARPAGPRAQHHRDLHQRQRRRVAVAERAAVQPQVDAVGRRHPRAGASFAGRAAFPPARCRRSGGHHDGPDRLDSRRGGRGGAARGQARRHQPASRSSKAVRQRSSARSSGAPTPATTTRRRCAAATGSCWSTATTSWSSTCARTSANGTTWPTSDRTSPAVSSHSSPPGKPT